MIYLDDRIEFTINIPAPLPDSGIYKYELYKYVAEDNPELVFVGNSYYVNANRVRLDLTDIVRSQKTYVPKKYFTDGTWDVKIDAGLMNYFKVKMYFGESVYDSGWKCITMCYRYPNYQNTDNYNNGENVFFDIYSGVTTRVTVALQGYKRTNKTLPLTPHYPLKWTQKYKYAQAFIFGSLIQDIDVYLYRGAETYSYTFHATDEQTGTAVALPINSFALPQELDTESGDISLVYKKISLGIVTEETTLAIFDECYKRYYLFWQDRFGGYQSQAFNDYAKYSETFETTETQNYKNERKKSNILIQPKWNLNSGWIAENVYPLYESILVSPVLFLYDAYEDRLHEVIVNSDYTEKTYRNEKKLLSLNLELEAITKQNIIY